jgi:hypothetical protein
VAEGGGLLNRTGSRQPVTKQAKTRDFLSISLNLNSVLCLPMCREASRSLHNLLHLSTDRRKERQAYNSHGNDVDRSVPSKTRSSGPRYRSSNP